EHRQGFVLGGQVLAADHEAQPLDDELGRDQLEVEALHSAQDRHRHLVHFSSGKDELDVRGRLFQRLEECVPGALGKHVDLVYDHDLVAIARRAVGQRFLKTAYLVHAVVTRAIYLLHVHVGAERDLFAGRTLEARGSRWARAVQTVERFGEDACAGRFANAANTGEQKRVSNTVMGDRIGQGRRDMVLPDQIRE